MCKRRRLTPLPCRGLSPTRGPPAERLRLPSSRAPRGPRQGGATRRRSRQRRAGGRCGRRFHAGRPSASGADLDHVAGPGSHWRRRPAVCRQTRGVSPRVEPTSRYRTHDMVLMIGARMDMALTGLRARQARPPGHEGNGRRGRCRNREDADANPTADSRGAAAFLLELERQLEGRPCQIGVAWLARCQSWKRRYPVLQPEYRRQRDGVSTYVLSEAISAELDETAVVASGSSGAAIELFLLSFQAKAGQRVLHSRGMGAMGFGLPASVGAC